jgi:prepilin-type N-terminal cleavage/methylation domain-containing protein
MKGCERQGGFTLIELLVVMAIIAILAAALGLVIWGLVSSAAVKKTKVLIRSLEPAIQAYYDEWSDYPPQSIDGRQGAEVLHYLLGRRIDVPVSQDPVTQETTYKRRDRPYFTFEGWQIEGSFTGDFSRPHAVIDAWRVPLRYEKPGRDHRSEGGPDLRNEYELTSAGPDNQFDTEDDIPRWRAAEQ